jgi:hypothetical protein
MSGIVAVRVSRGRYDRRHGWQRSHRRLGSPHESGYGERGFRRSLPSSNLSSTVFVLTHYEQASKTALKTAATNNCGLLRIPVRPACDNSRRRGRGSVSSSPDTSSNAGGKVNKDVAERFPKCPGLCILTHAENRLWCLHALVSTLSPIYMTCSKMRSHGFRGSQVWAIKGKHNCRLMGT